MPRFAANLSMLFTETDFLSRFRLAANAGFAAVEFLFPYDFRPGEIGERLFHNGLKLVLFNSPPGRWEAGERGLAALPGREGEFQDSVGRALDYAKALNCKQVHVLAGVVGDSIEEREAAQATYIENLRFAATAAARERIAVLIEPINSRRDIPGYFLNHTGQARDIIAQVGSNNLFLQFDLYHVQIMEGDLAETFAANIDVIRHIQIAGVPGRHEPDHGEINYPYLFNYIDHLGYQGWIGCEYRPAGGTLEGLNWAFDFGISGTGGG